MLLFSLDTWSLFAIFTGLLVIYNIALVIYRLYLHPLRNFPGPKLNAATLWVDFYYDVYLRGQMTFKLKDWHDEYGPIVRITPDEVHILDPDFYDDIYTGASRPRDKWYWWTRAVGQQTTMFATRHHDHHRMRRGVLSPYFSKKNILEDALPIVRSKVNRFLERLRKSALNQDIIRMDIAFTALTLDIITEYALDRESDYLNEPDFFQGWHECMKTGVSTMAFGRHFHFVFVILINLPSAVMQKIAPPSFADLIRAGEQIEADVQRTWGEDVDELGSGDTKSKRRRNMIHTIRDASQLPPAERTPQRVVDETALLLSAGSETTAHMLSMTSYYLLKNSEVLSTLREELLNIVPKGMSIFDVEYNTLEKLPYLTAVINEGLRMSYGVIARLPRLVTPGSKENLKYKGWEIPKDTPFSMSGYYVITDPAIFPEPDTFKPERWLLPSEVTGSSKWKVNNSLTKYLTNFSKGTRACLGINLAYAEIYSTLAMLTVHVLGSETEVGMELYDVDFDRDVKLKHEYFTGFPTNQSRGIRMRSVKG